MREIKFRGMDANGVMRYGRLSQDKPNETLYWEEYSQRICWDDSNIPISNKTLGQFTGLLDSKGKEIWEGDILNDGHENQKVIFSDGCFTLEKTTADLNHQIAEEWEVIGNIYESPTLLTKGIE